MELLFLGSVIPMGECNKYIGPSVAGNKMQIGLLNSIKKKKKVNLSVYTECPYGAYPKTRFLFINGQKLKINDQLIANKIPYVNVFIIKQITLILSATIKLFSWVYINRKKQKTILCYNAYPYISIPVLIVSKFTNINSVCIFADPPIDTIGFKGLKKIFNIVESNFVRQCLSKFSSLVVLNKAAAQYYLPGKKTVVVDGGFDINDLSLYDQSKREVQRDKIVLLYCGALEKYSGIMNLVEAMDCINIDNVILKIYGRGSLLDEIIDKSRYSNRIQYCGVVSNEEMIQIQKKASFLVNPRILDDPVSQFTFPSKIIEYMLSGTPVLSTRLNGLTDDYFDYILTFNSDDVKDIADKIIELVNISYEDLLKSSVLGRDYIIENKNWDIQLNKIIPLLYRDNSIL